MKLSPAKRSLLFAAIAPAMAFFLAPSASLAAGDESAAKAFPPIPKSELQPPTLGSREPELQVDYPGSASARGVTKGSAMVDVLVGADGKPLDFLAVGYSDKAFGDALLAKAKMLEYTPGKFKGVPIPARCVLAYQFESGGLGISKNAMDEAESKFNHSDAITMAVPEDKLDAPLEFTDIALPRVPAGFKTEGDQPVRAYVTFFVDEEGKVHVPEVVSAASPELVANAIHAVRLWTFKPALVKGKPVVAYAGRPVRFVPRDLKK